MAHQTCRVCGARVPSGFTNCDGCYHKNGKGSEKAIKLIQKITVPLPEKTS